MKKDASGAQVPSKSSSKVNTHKFDTIYQNLKFLCIVLYTAYMYMLFMGWVHAAKLL